MNKKNVKDTCNQTLEFEVSKNEEKEIEFAVNQFENLLRSQVQRSKKMALESATAIEDKKETVIGLCDGDGIGSIIMKEGMKVLEKVLNDELKSGKIKIVQIDGLTIENRLEKGQSVPKDVLEKIKACDLLLKGPTETPKGGTLESANVTLRRELDLYANIRPVKVESQNIDWTFFRENTEGEYALGSKGIEISNLLSMDFKVTTESGTKRIAKAAFEFARQNGKNKVAIVTKANIMKKTDGNFSKICNEVAKDYPEIEAKDYYIDIMAANLVNEKIRSDFQVFLLPNLYGDILTDEAAEIQGGVGTAGSINAGSRYAMFEAVHGTAPQLIKDGLGEYANPASIIKAIEIMIRYIGLVDKADRLEKAIEEVSNDKTIKMTGTKDGNKASEYADAIVRVYR